MPELPEVETVTRHLQPRLLNQTVLEIIVRQPKLRWTIPAEISTLLPGVKIKKIFRRGKYILLLTTSGTLIIHLGMSGCLHLLEKNSSPTKHDHIDIIFKNHSVLRYHDPRRFGCILWATENYQTHPLLANLGPEPFANEFSGKYLFQLSRKRKVPIKSFLMDNKTVVGIGNIYANESLFLAGIHPLSSADCVSEEKYKSLAKISKQVLKKAIQLGGTTLNDFADPNGNPGYFSQELYVYGREHLPCLQCKTLLQKVIISQRSSVYCSNCQPICK